MFHAGKQSQLNGILQLFFFLDVSIETSAIIIFTMTSYKNLKAIVIVVEDQVWWNGLLKFASMKNSLRNFLFLSPKKSD